MSKLFEPVAPLLFAATTKSCAASIGLAIDGPSSWKVKEAAMFAVAEPLSEFAPSLSYAVAVSVTRLLMVMTTVSLSSPVLPCLMASN